MFSSDRCGPDGETVSVAFRRHAEAAQERPAHGLRGAEPAAGGDRRHGLVVGLQQRACSLQPDPLDVPGRRLADLGREDPGEMALAHADCRGQDGGPVVGARVCFDQVLRPRDRCGAAAGSPHRNGVLALPAGPSPGHHQVTGHDLGEVGVVVVVDQGEREIDAGRHTARRPQVAVAQVQPVRVDHGAPGNSCLQHAGFWTSGWRRSVPLSRPARPARKAPVQTVATRRACGAAAPDPSHRSRIGRCRPGAVAARQQQGVDG